MATPARARAGPTTGAIAAGGGVAEPAVVVEDLTIERGGRRVVDGLSFAVAAGAVTGLVGPSGSGKSTLLRAIVGTQRVRGGRVTVLGEPAGSPQLRGRVGYTTQAPSVYGDLTVTANVRYFAAVYGVTDRVADEKIGEVGLSDHADQLAATLSGGERARLSLGCALVASPDLLLLDEPTVGIDPVLRADLWGRFHDLASAGKTLVVTSHVMDEAGRCDRLMLLRDGHLMADETPAQLRGATAADDLEAAFLRLILRADRQGDS